MSSSHAIQQSEIAFEGWAEACKDVAAAVECAESLLVVNRDPLDADSFSGEVDSHELQGDQSFQADRHFRGTVELGEEELDAAAEMAA